MKKLLETIVSDKNLHALWVNTLSYLENCGARKIAACEHPLLVKKEMLKHAEEEFRHAHYLKKQIARITKTPLPNYSLKYLLGGIHTKNYLDALDIQVCRFLKTKKALNRVSVYHLVTYAIEVRAEKFYPLYHDVLNQVGSKITVKSIILEEMGHLSEMKKGLKTIPNGLEYAQKACEMENTIYDKWVQNIGRFVNA